MARSPARSPRKPSSPSAKGRSRNPAQRQGNPYGDNQPLLQLAADTLLDTLVYGPDPILRKVTAIRQMSENLLRSVTIWCGENVSKVQAYVDATGHLPSFDLELDERPIDLNAALKAPDPLMQRMFLLGIEPDGYGPQEPCYVYVRPSRETAAEMLRVLGAGRAFAAPTGLFGGGQTPPPGKGRQSNPLPQAPQGQGHRGAASKKGTTSGKGARWVPRSQTKPGRSTTRSRNPHDFVSIPMWGSINLSRPLDRFDLAIQREILGWAHRADYEVTAQMREVWPRIIRQAMDVWCNQDTAATIFKRTGVVPEFALNLIPAGPQGDLVIGDRDPSPYVTARLTEFRQKHHDTSCAFAQLVSVDGYQHPDRGVVLEGLVVVCPRGDFAKHCGAWPLRSTSVVLT